MWPKSFVLTTRTRKEKAMDKQKIGNQFRALVGFYLRDREGTMVAVKKGDVITLSSLDEIEELMLEGRILPLSMPEKGEYRLLKDYEMRISGEIKRFDAGDVITLDAETALRLMLLNTVEPTDEDAWRFSRVRKSIKFSSQGETFYGARN